MVNLGRDMRNAHAVQEVSLSALQSKYQELFSEGLGEVRGTRRYPGLSNAILTFGKFPKNWEIL